MSAEEEENDVPERNLFIDDPIMEKEVQNDGNERDYRDF